MRTIEAHALWNKAEEMYIHTKSGKIIPVMAVPTWAINNAPTIDSFPVVRCYQCKHVTCDWITGNFLCARNRKVEGNIVYGGFLVDKYDYCSFGVKSGLEE